MSSQVVYTSMFYGRVCVCLRAYCACVAVCPCVCARMRMCVLLLTWCLCVADVPWRRCWRMAACSCGRQQTTRPCSRLPAGKYTRNNTLLLVHRHMHPHTHTHTRTHVWQRRNVEICLIITVDTPQVVWEQEIKRELNRQHQSTHTMFCVLHMNVTPNYKI